MFTAPHQARLANRFIRMLHIVQRGLNLLLRLAFGRKGCESALFSPNLIFVARKLTSWNVWSRERELSALAAWDSAQAVTENVVRYAFVPAVVLLAAYQTQVPLWAFVSPI